MENLTKSPGMKEKVNKICKKNTDHTLLIEYLANTKKASDGLIAAIESLDLSDENLFNRKKEELKNDATEEMHSKFMGNIKSQR